jgi:phosphomannomutase
MPDAPYTRTYAEFLRSFLSPATPIRVVFDFSNGPTELIVPRIVEGNRLITPLFVDRTLSGNFPGHGPNPLVGGALIHLHREVLLHHADLGVIFDADGDRAFFVDHRGRSVPAFVIAALLARHERPPFVFDTRTLLPLERTGLAPAGATLAPVGSFFIRAAMRRTGAGFAAEYSGHCYFKDFFSADSGILTALKVVNAVTRLPYPLADFCDLLPHHIAVSELNVRSEAPAETIARLSAHYRPHAKKYRKFDGITLDFGDWFMNARPSNTESLVRIFGGSANALLLRGKMRECERVAAGNP